MNEKEQGKNILKIIITIILLGISYFLMRSIFQINIYFILLFYLIILFLIVSFAIIQNRKKNKITKILTIEKNPKKYLQIVETLKPKRKKHQFVLQIDRAIGYFYLGEYEKSNEILDELKNHKFLKIEYYRAVYFYYLIYNNIVIEKIEKAKEIFEKEKIVFIFYEENNKFACYSAWIYAIMAMIEKKYEKAFYYIEKAKKVQYDNYMEEIFKIGELYCYILQGNIEQAKKIKNQIEQESLMASTLKQLKKLEKNFKEIL